MLYLAVLVQGAVALWLGSRGWFSGDLLRYYVERGGAPGASENLMEPHAAHWQLTLILVYLLLFKLIGLTTYVPYLALTVLVHLALVLVMHHLLRRLGAGRVAALLSALLLLTYGAGLGGVPRRGPGRAHCLHAPRARSRSSCWSVATTTPAAPSSLPSCCWSG